MVLVENAFSLAALQIPVTACFSWGLAAAMFSCSSEPLSGHLRLFRWENDSVCIKMQMQTMICDSDEICSQGA